MFLPHAVDDLLAGRCYRPTADRRIRACQRPSTIGMGPGMTTTFLAVLEEERERLLRRLEEVEHELGRLERASAVEAGLVATGTGAAWAPANDTRH